MDNAGFRPLSGIKVSEPSLDGQIESFLDSFRPLSGIKVSEQIKARLENSN